MNNHNDDLKEAAFIALAAFLIVTPLWLAFLHTLNQ